jgi:hypothetical protein
MKFTGFLFDSLKIESASNRWASRLLFVVVFAFSAIMRISPPGDPDLKGVIEWLNKFETMNSDQISQLSLPHISTGNIIYLATSFIAAILFVLFIFLSTYIFFSDHPQENQKYSLSGFAKSLPSLLVLVLLLLIPVNFLAQFPIFLLLAIFVISAVYLSPAIIFIEKKPALVSIMKSVKKTYGFKLSIFMNVLTLYTMQQIISWLFSLLINVESVGFYLIDGFLFAFLVFAIGKNIGAFYIIAKDFPETI